MNLRPSPQKPRVQEHQEELGPTNSEGVWGGVGRDLNHEMEGENDGTLLRMSQRRYVSHEKKATKPNTKKNREAGKDK